MSTHQLATNFIVEKDGVRYEFEPGDRGGYVVHVPVYPSCASEGETFEEAMVNIEDALMGCLDVARELGLEIPEELCGFLEGRTGG